MQVLQRIIRGWCKKMKWDEMTKEERRAYVNQDSGTHRELYINPGVCDSKNWDSPWGANRSDYIVVYELYFLDKMPITEIAYHVKYSTQYIRDIVSNLKTNIEKEEIKDKRYLEKSKDILRSHFIDGKSVTEISKIFNTDAGWVSRKIKSYLLKYKPYRVK